MHKKKGDVTYLSYVHNEKMISNSKQTNLIQTVWSYGMMNDILPAYPGDGNKMECFICHHKSLTVTRKNGGMIKCWCCDLKGGTKDLAKALVYQSTGYDMNKRSSINYILRIMSGKNIDVDLDSFAAPIGSEICNNSVDPDVANQFNSALIESMQDVLKGNNTLNPHRGLLEASYNDLINRGFTDKDIDKIGFIQAIQTTKDGVQFAKKIKSKGVDVKSMPGSLTNRYGETQLLALSLKNRLQKFGYIDNKGHWSVDNLTPQSFVHYMIPVHDFNGRIRYFQVAWDKRISGKTIDKSDKACEPKEIKFPKYTAYSTKSYKDGAAINATCGWVGDYITLSNPSTGEKMQVPDLKGSDRIFVTEGTLKAPLFYSLCNRIYGSAEPGFSIAGVNNIKYLEQDLILLKQLYPNLKYLDDCLDMDRFTNDEVMAASYMLREMCEKIGIGYHMRVWNPEFKGCDDFMKHLLDYKNADFSNELYQKQYAYSLEFAKNMELAPKTPL